MFIVVPLFSPICTQRTPAKKITQMNERRCEPTTTEIGNNNNNQNERFCVVPSCAVVSIDKLAMFAFRLAYVRLNRHATNAIQTMWRSVDCLCWINARHFACVWNSRVIITMLYEYHERNYVLCYGRVARTCAQLILDVWNYTRCGVFENISREI